MEHIQVAGLFSSINPMDDRSTWEMRPCLSEVWFLPIPCDPIDTQYFLTNITALYPSKYSNSSSGRPISLSSKWEEPGLLAEDGMSVVNRRNVDPEGERNLVGGTAEACIDRNNPLEIIIKSVVTQRKLLFDDFKQAFGSSSGRSCETVLYQIKSSMLAFISDHPCHSRCSCLACHERSSKGHRESIRTNRRLESLEICVHHLRS